jgi:glycosyltransferase 2 family protein
VKNFLVAVVLLLAIAFGFSSLGEMGKTAAVLRSGDWRFLVGALALEAGWLFIIGATYTSLYKIVGISDSTRRLWKLGSAANFSNVIAPTGGISAAAVLISDARRYNNSIARATVVYALFVFFDYTGLLCVLTVGLGILASRNSLHFAEITASIILLMAAMGLAAILYLAMLSEILLGKVLSVCARGINKALRPIIHRNYLMEARAFSFASELAEGIADLKQNPRELLSPLGLALANKSILMAILWMVAMAFQTPLPAEVLVAGFSMGYLFVIVSPTPSGIGIMEGAMALSLRSLGLALETAAIITLSFRGITFWVPLLVGAINFRNLHTNLDDNS